MRQWILGHNADCICRGKTAFRRYMSRVFLDAERGSIRN